MQSAKRINALVFLKNAVLKVVSYLSQPKKEMKEIGTELDFKRIHDLCGRLIIYSATNILEAAD